MKKKIIILAALSLGTLSFTSCKKDYTCKCMVNEEEFVYNYKDQSKGESEKACDEQNKAAKLVDPSGSCTLSKTDK